VNLVDTDTRTEGKPHDDTPRAALGRRVTPTTIAALVGGAGLLGGLRAFRRGERTRGAVRIAVGAAVLGVALLRRRAGGADEAAAAGERGPTEVEPDAEGVDEASGAVGVGTAEATGGAADAPSGATAAAEGGPEAEDIDRLGAAAVDWQSREVPVPQRAFNQGFLAHSSEAFWGVSDRDDSVVVSADYDAVERREGVRYVASSEIGADARELPIPDAVLDHWDEVYGGGTAVTGGDDILFVTTEELAAVGLLRVLPAAWAANVPE
jgi:hypothetical protein